MAAAVIVLPTAELSFDVARLERVFARCFSRAFNTALEGGYDEPLYRPPGESGASGSIQYRADYFASALHEVAHWCMAGPERRLSVDYGYWYAPDGRDSRQQQAFEDVEYKPQAMEWFFARACGYPFRISVDNLGSGDGEIPDTLQFKERVLAQAQHWQCTGLPSRAGQFFSALRREFERPGDRFASNSEALAALSFSLTELN